jgi:transposase
MRFVPPKSLQQQSELMVHRARQGSVQQRTATIRILGARSVLQSAKDKTDAVSR